MTKVTIHYQAPQHYLYAAPEQVQEPAHRGFVGDFFTYTIALIAALLIIFTFVIPVIDWSI